MKNDRLKEAIDVRLSSLHGTPESRKRIMKCVMEERVVKRKLRYSAVVAATLMILMASVALAVGNNLFGLFADRYDDPASNDLLKDASENAVLSTAEPVDINEDAWVQIDSTLFDGNKLMVAYRLKDDANVMEAWEPTKGELGELEEITDGTLPIFEQQNDALATFYANYKAGKPTGIHIAETYRRDHSYTDDGIDLPYTEEETMKQDDVMLNYILYDFMSIHDDSMEYAEGTYHLDEKTISEIRQRDSLQVTLLFSRNEQWYWFDGKKLYLRLLVDKDEFAVNFTATNTNKQLDDVIEATERTEE